MVKERPSIRPVSWQGATRLVHSPSVDIDIYEDLAPPADWPLLISAERKLARLAESGRARLPQERQSSYDLSMAPFVHLNLKRKSRFSGGTFGALYAGKTFETALKECAFHHGRFMGRTREAEGWCSRYREIRFAVSGRLVDLQRDLWRHGDLLDPDGYRAGQAFAREIREAGANGILYPSLRHDGGRCLCLFYPDLAGRPRLGRRLDLHWDGKGVDAYRLDGQGRSRQLP